MSIAVAAAIRIVLVLLFLPFSALDKLFNFNGAVGSGEARSSPIRRLARMFIVAGLAVEIFMSLGVCERASTTGCAPWCWQATVRGDGAVVEAVLDAGRLLVGRRRSRARPVLGLPEELRARRRIPADHFWRPARAPCNAFLDAPAIFDEPIRLAAERFA